MLSLHDILVRASELHRAGTLDEAAALYRRALIEDPAQPDALHLLGLLERRRGDIGHGVALMARALVCEPNLAVAYYNLGCARQDLGRLDEAAENFRQLLTLDPARSYALARLGADRLARGRIDEAERLLRHLATLGETDPRQVCALARCDTHQRIRAAATDPSLPAGIVVRGVFRDSSGYAYKVRQFVRHLVAAGVRVQLIDLHYGPNDDLSNDQLDPLLLELDRPVRAKAVLTFTTPPMVERIPGLKTVNYTVFEGVRIPPLWAAHSRRHDHVIVATESSREAWLRTGQPDDRIHICPEGVEAVPTDSIGPSCVVDAFGRRVADYPIRILNVSDLNIRKNLAGLLRVWLRATRAEDPAALILKVGKGAGIAQDFRALVAEVTAATGLSVERAAPVFLVDGKLSDRDMLSLFAAATHYWSMSHGEGWDLPMAQAGAMGRTLLAPRHSAYCAYLNDAIAHLIPSRVTPASEGYQGLDWWTPDEEAAAATLRAILADPVGTRRSAQGHLLDQFSWEAATRQLIGLLERLDAL